MRKMLSIILALIMVFALSATAYAADYTVQKGDSLWKIAQKTLGSGARWGEIYNLNRDSVKNPGLIYPGQVFHLPDGASAPAQTGTLPALPGDLPVLPGGMAGGLPGLGGGNLPPLPDGVTPEDIAAGLAGGLPALGGFSFDADYENVAYASNATNQVMNIYMPEKATGSDPAIVVVHGGGFKFGSQTMTIIEPIVKASMENGYVVASVDYRKSGEAAFPGALSDVKAAVRCLRANADKYGIDPDKIVIWGESAGAYLADMTALTASVAALDGDVTENASVSSAVAAMVSFYAPIEFYTMDDEFIALGDSKSANHSKNSFETDYLGISDMTADKEGVYKSWWGTYKDSLPETLPVWIQAGTADTNVPYTQSQNLASGLTEAFGADNVHFGLIEGAAHEDGAFYTNATL